MDAIEKLEKKMDIVMGYLKVHDAMFDSHGTMIDVINNKTDLVQRMCEINKKVIEIIK